MSLYTVTFESDSEYYEEEGYEDDGNQTNEKTKDSTKRRKKKILVKKRITKENIKKHPEIARNRRMKPPTPPNEPTLSRPQLRRSRSKFTSSQSEENIKEKQNDILTTPQRVHRRRQKEDNHTKSSTISEDDNSENHQKANDNEKEEAKKKERKRRKTPKEENEKNESGNEKEDGKEFLSDQKQITNHINQTKEIDDHHDKSDKSESNPIYDIIKYTIERTTKISIRGSRTHFQIYQNGSPLFHSKIKSHNADEVIKIAKGTETHFSSAKFDGYLRNDGIFTNFSLRTGYECGDEKLVIRYFKGKRENEPRTAQCTIRLGDGVPKIHINSKKPEMSDMGKWMVDDSLPRNAVSSIKNMVLLSTKDNSSVRLVKTSKNILEIEATDNIPPLLVFAIGISDFLCKL